MKNNYEAFILAGGKSKRMGNDKGLLLLQNKPVIQYVIDVLRPIFKKLRIISSNPEYDRFGIPRIEDHFLDKGPAAGIDTALQHTSAESVFIVSCDMPFIDSDSIQQLLVHSGGHEITLISNGSFIEPTFSVISKKCMPQWRQQLLQGTLKLSDFITKFDTKFVDSKLFLTKNPRLFANINTPGDLENAAAWMKA